MTPQTIRKTLSPNDAGETGGHQAGILIPKEPRILSFFPVLDVEERNPRCHLLFEDPVGEVWELAYIYYNNRRFGGTRNEYRLTRLTRYIRQAMLGSGDEIILRRDECGLYFIDHRFAGSSPSILREPVLRLGSGWTVIDIAR